jgi:hypothetical protein
MQVNIKGRDYEWTSDFDDGWVFSAGDPYKYPVSIGGKHSCFIKRFEKKQASGSRLIELLRAKKVPGLAKVYDIVQTEEEDVPVRYLFCECMDGGTLDDLIKKGWAPDAGRLLGDIIKAFGAMHGLEHWMSDFCEKNIFCKRDDAYCLIDLDSAHPTAARPNNEMYGNKDYWSGGLSYLSQQAKLANSGPGDVAGPVLNYLQLSLLIVRIKAGLVDKKEDYKSPSLLASLPGILDRTIPEFRGLFKALVKNGEEVPDAEDIKRIKELLITKVVNGELVYGEEAGGGQVDHDGEEAHDDEDEDADNDRDDVDGGDAEEDGKGGHGKGGGPGVKVLPVIRSFSSDKKRLREGGPFTLSWQVEKGEKVVIYRNGKMRKETAKGLGALTLTERYDGIDKAVEFRLVVSNSEGEVSSPPLIVNIGGRSWLPAFPTEPAVVKMLLLKIAAGVVFVLLVLGIIWAVRHFGRPSPVVIVPHTDTAVKLGGVQPPPLVDSFKRFEDSINRRRDSIIRAHNALIAAENLSDKPKTDAPKPPKPGKIVPQVVVHDTVRVVSEAERVRQAQEERERAYKEMKAEVRKKVRDSVRVMDTVLTKKKMVVFRSGNEVLGIENRSHFFLDTVVVEITPGGEGKPYRKEFYNVAAGKFTILMNKVPKEGIKQSSLVSVIF